MAPRSLCWGGGCRESPFSLAPPAAHPRPPRGNHRAAPLRLEASFPSAQPYVNSATNRLEVVEEFTDVETAKRTGRTSFNKMMTFIRKRKANPPVVLVEKTDRLYRNLRDWVTVDDLGVEVHLVKENVVISEESRSSEMFMHGIKVLMAKNYLVADPERAILFCRLFERYVAGEGSLKDIAVYADDIGLRGRRGRKAPLLHRPQPAAEPDLRRRVLVGRQGLQVQRPAPDQPEDLGPGPGPPRRQPRRPARAARQGRLPGAADLLALRRPDDRRAPQGRQVRLLPLRPAAARARSSTCARRSCPSSSATRQSSPWG